jgi:hypothetical protein
MDPDLNDSTHSDMASFDLAVSEASLPPYKMPLPVAAKWKPFDLSHQTSLEAFFLRKPTEELKTLLKIHHPTVPRDGKRRIFQKFFLGSVQDRTGSQQTNFAKNQYTLEALRLVFPDKTSDMSSVCSRCHQIHKESYSAASSKPSASSSKLSSAKRTSKKTSKKTILDDYFPSCDEDCEQAEYPLPPKLARSQAAKSSKATSTTKKRSRAIQEDSNEEDEFRPVPKKAKSAAKFTSSTKTDCQPCPLTASISSKNVTLTLFHASECLGFCSFHLNSSYGPGIVQLLRADSEAALNESSPLGLAMKDWAIAMMNTVDKSRYKLPIPKNLITGGMPLGLHVFTSGSSTPPSVSSPTTLTSPSSNLSHYSFPGARHVMPGTSKESKKLAFVRKPSPPFLLTFS